MPTPQRSSRAAIASILPSRLPTDTTSKSKTEELNTPTGDTDSAVGSEDTQSSEFDGRSSTPSQTGVISSALTRSLRCSPRKEQDEQSFSLLSPLPESMFRPNSTSSILKPGRSWSGYQKSDNSRYKVNVKLQNVDMKGSYLDGYLQIHSLTKEHPTLTTFFEGEMIGSKHSFVTDHPEWHATETIDFRHWSSFPPFRTLLAINKDAKKRHFRLKNWEDKQFIFMRWKEHFLVPDHRKTDLTGASFDGFYYICFNQVTGAIIGTYYHARCEQ